MKLFVAILFIASGRAEPPSNSYLPPTSTGTSASNATVSTTPPNLPPSIPSASPTSIYNVPVTVTQLSGPNSSPSIFYGSPVVAYSGPIAPPIPILRLSNYFNSDGRYAFDYETANHIAFQESGHQKAADTREVQGSYSYLAPNGQIISLAYVADENGFRPVGEHLPTPPPIPEAILKSLEFNAAEAARGIVDDGQYRPVAKELVLYGSPSVSSQYLPPGTQEGYKY